MASLPPRFHAARLHSPSSMLYLFGSCLGLRRCGRHAHQDSYTFDRELRRSLQPRNQVFSLGALQAATSHFNPKHKLGEGGFGAVYKGTLPDGTNIAVKKLSPRSEQGKDEFVSEVKVLTTVQHRNLIKLLGCCVQEPERMLVYEYIPNRSLDIHLFDRTEASSLDWHTRCNIIMGTARGLSYLHEGLMERIIHRDIKASNILLDEKMNPKIADFGLARLFNFDDTHISTKVAGTPGYLAPEYLIHGNLTEKADVFSFGILVLEIISGRRNADTGASPDNQRLLDLAWTCYQEQRQLELVDPKIREETFSEEVMRVLHVALLCTQAKADLRPKMSRVILLLAGQSEILEQPAKPPSFKLERNTKLKGIQIPSPGMSSAFSRDSLSSSVSSYASCSIMSASTVVKLTCDVSQMEAR